MAPLHISSHGSLQLATATLLITNSLQLPVPPVSFGLVPQEGPKMPEAQSQVGLPRVVTEPQRHGWRFPIRVPWPLPNQRSLLDTPCDSTFVSGNMRELVSGFIFGFRLPQFIC